jgi:hypothetical protein
VNPASAPRSIDVVFDEGPSQGTPLRGIYELSNETYKVCLALEGQERPKLFESPPGTAHVLELFKREQPDARKP